MLEKKSIYLGGAMTARKDLGKRWRRKLTPFLVDNGWEVKDPTVYPTDIWSPIIKVHGC